MNSFSDTRKKAEIRAKAGKGFCLVVGLALLAGCEKELILEGERFNPRTPLEASVRAEGEAQPTDSFGQIENQSVAISLPAARANADWTHRSANVAHLMPHASLSAAPVRVWSVDIGAGNSRKYRITAAPIVADGRVFTMDATTGVSAVATSGAKLWSVNLMPAGARGEVSGGGLAYGGGRLFVSTGHAELVAVDPASGGVIWRQNLLSPAAGTPTVADGVVYVVGRNGMGWAIDSKDGKVLWQLPGTPSNNGIVSSAAPAVTARTVLFPFGNGDLAAALKSGGVKLWTASIAGARLGRGYNSVTDIAGDPVVDGATTYVGNQSGRLSALDTASGSEKWSAREAAYGAVLPVGGSVFLISDEAKLVRLDAATGQPIWAVDMPYYESAKEKRRAAITAHYGPVLASGRLVVVSGDGVVRLFNPTNGALVGTADLPGGAASAPALAGGVLYVVSGNGQLHAFR
ncbi:quinoprotein [Pseudorhodobacter sp. E13]|uniref:outer membrane protein assembly factor BamB family protein n=1 Tax=Pseudorhodobacter sp. E13 TaxID=2487931 RepID=UPI000F8EB0B9|nr:PQQ-like beta-propeller repeat protein [Pseudorhodobacter sp. E13]RUS60607.1 quinoprotein [Pseudorhodobacter sp. E13]